MSALIYGVEGKQSLINAGRVGTYQLIMRSDVITSSGKNLFITNGLVCDQLYKRWVESGSELDTPSLTVGGKTLHSRLLPFLARIQLEDSESGEESSSVICAVVSRCR